MPIEGIDPYSTTQPVAPPPAEETPPPESEPEPEVISEESTGNTIDTTA